MSVMWPKIFHSLSHNRWGLATLSAITLFLSFECFGIVPLILLFPALLNRLTFQIPTFWTGFRWGFWTSFVIMLGGFYWVIYVIHEFGYLPWSVSTLLYLGFCGFGALNFPLYVATAALLHRKIKWEELNPTQEALWYSLSLPALFTLFEFAVPKLFPWYVGHCLYKAIYLTQIVEITGATYLTFAIFSLGSAIGLLLQQYGARKKLRFEAVIVPSLLWALAIGFSLLRLSQTHSETRPFRVLMVQPNIGSLEKVEARRGIAQKVRAVVDQYKSMTSEALEGNTPPDLILWPETAMPFILSSVGEFPTEIRDWVTTQKIPLLTGAYAPGENTDFIDYNAAYLLEPLPPFEGRGPTLHLDVYKKNILLAFGEYMPFGELFPSLYQAFPQVSHFKRGKKQNSFLLKDGTRLGVTICYEAIVPEFYRKVVQEPVHAVINLTNDSWFGPTSEPYLHGALTIFRAIEHRTPLFRVTNTGTSFSVDAFGRMSRQTPVYDKATLVTELNLNPTPVRTIYGQFGDWFILCIGVILIIQLYSRMRKTHAPISV